MDLFRRVCAGCGLDWPISYYSVSQRALPAGVALCARCFGGHPSIPALGEFESGRYNISLGVSVPQRELENPFSQGGFRWVAKGSYNSGPRTGQACVVKWLKAGAVFEADYFSLDIKAVEKALEIVHQFNESNIINMNIRVNVPTTGVFLEGSGERTGSYVLCEPFIHNYQKFNSNTGWHDSSMAWGEVMQALSHFSYYITGGQFVLCDLQGGVYQNEVVLSDPAILSQGREYGVTDLGPAGISTFFSLHRCNAYCRPDWPRPENPLQVYQPVPGTTVVARTVAMHTSQLVNTYYHHTIRTDQGNPPPGYFAPPEHDGCG